MAGYT
jgi:putative transposase